MLHAIGQYGTSQHSTHKEMECYEYYIKCRHVSQITQRPRLLVF
jgi:hypothetical protein